MDKKLLKQILDFQILRGWDKVHTPSNLSRSIIIEAAELLEHFQWEENNYDKDKVCDELADILIYALSLCNTLQVTPKEIIENKLKKVDKKYPVHK